MTAAPEGLDDILAKLAKDIESAVHSLYRRQAGASTTQVRTTQFVKEARARVEALITGVRPSAAQTRFTAAVVGNAAQAGESVTWTADEAAAVMKCINAWLPMGSPKSAAGDSKCVAAGRELLPNWGERELAKGALRKVPTA